MMKREAGHRAVASVRGLGEGTIQARAGRFRWLMTRQDSATTEPGGDSAHDDIGAPPQSHFLAAAIAWHAASYRTLAAETDVILTDLRIDATLDLPRDMTGTGRCRLHLTVTVESPGSLAEIARLRAGVMARCPVIGLLRAGADVTIGLEHVTPVGRKAAA